MAISATRIKTLALCKRRYGFTYLQGRREAAGKSADAGSKTHELLELDDIRGDETWQGYEIGKLALALKAQTPANVQSREAEVHAEIEGIPFMGRIDFTTDDAVGDYKTTSKRKGLRTAEQLIDDPQRLLYTRMTGLTNSLWIYGFWDSLTAEPVLVPGDEARDVEKFRLHVLQPAEEIMALGLSGETDPMQLEPNVTACGLYPPHGCPFLDDCYDKGGALIQPRERDMSVFDNYKPHLTQPMRLKEAQPANDNKLIGTLYVDAYPVTGDLDVQPASRLISEASQIVCEDQEVKHSQLIDFGKGQYMLAAQLIENMRQAGTYYDNMYLETRSSEGKACLFELTNVARIVVKGMI